MGGNVWIDGDANGFGWFVDPTPADDLEFAPGTMGPARDRVDLLTVVLHELGHVLGFEHTHDGGVMDESLTPGRAPHAHRASAPSRAGALRSRPRDWPGA